MKVIHISITSETAVLISDTGTIHCIPYYQNISEKLYGLIIRHIAKDGYFECDFNTLIDYKSITQLLEENNIDLGSLTEEAVKSIEPLVEEAVISGNRKGLQLFIDKLNKVNTHRTFSVDSCLDFLKHNDMPITTNGNILGYKWLDLLKEDEHTYVDTYSGNIRQHVGSIVCCKEQDVDPDRAKECSYGLHVASKEYVNNYYGEALALVLVRPEDIITVPERDPSKVRVMQYQILCAVNGANKTKALETFIKELDLEYWVNYAETHNANEQVMVDCKTNTCTITPIEQVPLVIPDLITPVMAKRVVTVKEGIKNPKNDLKKLKKKQVQALVDKYQETGVLTLTEYNTILNFTKKRKKSLAFLFPELDEIVFLNKYQAEKNKE